MKLGRLPHNPTALAKAPSFARHKLASFVPPPRLIRNVEFEPGLYKNDRLPVCTAAALINCARAVAELNGYALNVVGDRVPAFYAECVGCADTDEAIAATQGAVMLDVMIRQMDRGFVIGPTGPNGEKGQELVGLFGVLPESRTALANAMALLGHAAIGVTLYDRDMQNADSAAPWDTEPGQDDGTAAGGHAVMLWDYTGLGDADTIRVGTWGKWKSATQRWVEARSDERYALLWRQLAQATGISIGVDFPTLKADLEAMELT